jgi:hypothetical protein
MVLDLRPTDHGYTPTNSLFLSREIVDFETFDSVRSYSCFESTIHSRFGAHASSYQV